MVLIAAAFCMFNRYVDGLATWQPIAGKVQKGGKHVTGDDVARAKRHGFWFAIPKSEFRNSVVRKAESNSVSEWLKPYL